MLASAGTAVLGSVKVRHGIHVKWRSWTIWRRYSTMLAENFADTTAAHEPESILALPPVAQDGSGADGGVARAAAGPVDGGEGDDLEGAVGMEIEGVGDGDFTVEDEAEQVSSGWSFGRFVMSVEMHG